MHIDTTWRARHLRRRIGVLALVIVALGAAASQAEAARQDYAFPKYNRGEATTRCFGADLVQLYFFVNVVCPSPVTLSTDPASDNAGTYYIWFRSNAGTSYCLASSANPAYATLAVQCNDQPRAYWILRYKAQNQPDSSGNRWGYYLYNVVNGRCLVPRSGYPAGLQTLPCNNQAGAYWRYD